MKKIAEDRKREKIDNRAARLKVKEQIARDHEEREACSQSSVSTTQPTADVKKEYTTCRLQVFMGAGLLL